MFPKNQRLTKEKEIKAVFDGRLSFYNSFFGLKLKINNLGKNRYTVIIGKKTAKLAVDRNKIKRRIKYILRQNERERKYFYDFVVVCLKKAEELDFAETKKNIESLLFRVK